MYRFWRSRDARTGCVSHSAENRSRDDFCTVTLHRLFHNRTRFGLLRFHVAVYEIRVIEKKINRSSVLRLFVGVTRFRVTSRVSTIERGRGGTVARSLSVL